MRVRFESSHPAGDYAGGVLSVGILREGAPGVPSSGDNISFSVPRTFHTHNDSVAAALLTLTGRSCPHVRFNFPISAHCATLLRQYYGLLDIGPVDPSLEPRRPGRYLGLMLSGGLDSMGIWQVLTRVVGDDLRVVTTDYGPRFAFEAQGYLHFRRDVTCSTDLRTKGFWREGRFSAATPLLFADYLDLAAVVTGHHFVHLPLAIDSLRDGRPPDFLAHDAALLAGGLAELHIARCLNVTGMLLLAMLAEPETLEAAWRGSARPGSSKHYDKGVILRHLFQRAERTVPDYLRGVSRPHHREPFTSPALARLTMLYMIRHIGLAAVRREVSDLDEYDFSFAQALSLAFMERYNTSCAATIPQDLRSGVLKVFHQAGILPYSEQDYAELEIAREFFHCPEARRKASGRATQHSHSASAGEST